MVYVLLMFLRIDEGEPKMQSVQNIKLFLSVALTSACIVISYEIRNIFGIPAGIFGILIVLISFFIGAYLSPILISLVFKSKTLRRLLLGKSNIEGFWFGTTYSEKQKNAISYNAILYYSYKGSNLDLSVVAYRLLPPDLQMIFTRSELAILRERDSLYINYFAFSEGAQEVRGIAVGKFFSDGRTEYPNLYEGRVMTFRDGVYQRQIFEKIPDSVVNQYQRMHGE